MHLHPYITTISTLAVVINATCNVPQLVAMLRTRTSSGQSCLGWVLALAAIGLVRFYRHAPATETSAAPGPSPAPLAQSVIDMHTQEFVVLHDAVLTEHRRRTGEPELATA